MDEERGGALGHSREVGQAGPVLPWCGEHPFPSSPVTFLPSSRLSVFRGCQDWLLSPQGLAPNRPPMGSRKSVKDEKGV